VCLLEFALDQLTHPSLEGHPLAFRQSFGCRLLAVGDCDTQERGGCGVVFCNFHAFILGYNIVFVNKYFTEMLPFCAFRVYKGLIIPDVANKHLKGVYKRAGVPSLGRTQYSFRHTFETTLAGKVENKVLLELMAHTAFHPEYDHRKPEHVLAQLQPVRAILEDRT